MSDEALRQACERWLADRLLLERRGYRDPPFIGVKVEELVQLCKQQQAAGVRIGAAIANDEQVGDAGTDGDSGYNMACLHIKRLCEAQAKELER